MTSPSIRTRWLLGTLLVFVTLTWLLYPSSSRRKPHVYHNTSPYYQCRGDEILHNVAVIGAGSAGASAAYYLKKFRSPCQRINITVYERNPYVGGRSTTVNAYNDPGEPVELGASIFVKVNQNLVNALETFGLPIRNMQAHERPEVLGVWDGEKFVFTHSDSSNEYWNIAKILWKYGFSPIRTQNLMKKTVGSFLKMYQPPYFPFNSISDTASDLDLLSATAVTGQEFLKANSISEHFAHDIIQASTRVNYAQNLDQIHGLETMVCMAIEGAMSVQGGNWRIFDNMIKYSGANLLLNSSVTSITKNLTSNTYAIKSSTDSTDDDDNESTYNTVILASPLQFSNISFTPPLTKPPPQIPYVSLHVTLFTSPYSLSPTFFNLPPSSSEFPTTILTSTSPTNTTIPFFSISTLRAVYPPRRPGEDDEGDCATRDTEILYKIFSPEPMNDTFIHSLLDVPAEYPRWPGDEVVTWRYDKRWDSYPYLPPTDTFADLRLDQGGDDAAAGGLWYTSGIEQFISTMETSSLMG
ncbi:MAG: hypothetical protein Q9216_004986, partial [Gyalolechia sp. 2 TL-2023]